MRATDMPFLVKQIETVPPKPIGYNGTPKFCAACGKQWTPISEWQQTQITLCTACRQKGL